MIVSEKPSHTQGGNKMKFKSLSVFLSLLIITVLPFTAYAELTSDESGSPAVSDNYPPYELATPTQADQGHIATTAYVKGAYNDAITAVNTVADALESKQDSFLLNSVDINDPDGNSVSSGVMTNLDDVNSTHQLVNGMAVKNAINNVNNTISGVQSALKNKRVQIYTTWGGSGTAEVAFVNATPQP